MDNCNNNTAEDDRVNQFLSNFEIHVTHSGKPNTVLIKELDRSTDSSSYTDGSSSENENDDGKLDEKSNGESSIIYGHIQKLMRYLRTGNQTATVVALSCLKDEDLMSEVTRRAIVNSGGLQILINLLETNDKKCKVAALSVLNGVSNGLDVAKNLTDLGIIPNLVYMLEDTSRDLKCLAAQTIANVARIRKARKIVRKAGGVPKLIELLNVSETLLTTKKENLDAESLRKLQVVRTCCNALWSVSRCTKSKIEISKLQSTTKLFGQLLRSCHEEIIVPILGTVTQCASQTEFQLAIQKEGMIEDIVKYLFSKNDEIKTHCAYAIFKCAENEVTSNLVRQYGGLDPLVALIGDEATKKNKVLLSATTGAVWKCASNRDNIRRLDELETVPILLDLLQYENDEVLINAVGALAECAKFPNNKEIIAKLNGIPSLLALLNCTSEYLLENVTRILAECASDEDCIDQIVRNDGIRLLWSLLRSSSGKVRASAAWALVPCIQNAKDSGEMIRNFAGGLELLVSLLESDDERSLACVCASIAEVAKNEDNLAILTDLSVVNHLARLVATKNEMLQEHLSIAVANCCIKSENSEQFGLLNAVKPLICYVTSDKLHIQRAATLALYRLSFDEANCITMHKNGVVKLLLKIIASTDENLQESAAGCLSNIRSVLTQSRYNKLK